MFSTFHTFLDNRDIAFTFNVSYYDGYMIDEFNLLELGVNFERLYGKLESGKYRIVKRVYLGNIGIEHYISKEFVMKEEGE